MVKLTVKLLDAGTQRTFFGTEREVEDRLRTMFPKETSEAGRLMECIRNINDEGFAEVEVESYKDRTRHQLPEGFEKQEQSEDPWPREADDT